MSETTKFLPVHLTRWTRSENYIGPDLSDWYRVLSVNRDSNCLDKSNWEVGCDRVRKAAGIDAIPVDGAEPPLQILRFSSWGPGWIDVLMVHHTAPLPLLEAAEKILASLASYPVLDERDFSAKEWEKQVETWDGWDANQRRWALRTAGLDPKLARRKLANIDDDEGRLRSILLE